MTFNVFGRNFFIISPINAIFRHADANHRANHQHSDPGDQKAAGNTPDDRELQLRQSGVAFCPCQSFQPGQQ
jgi:hypothetical protein